MVLSKDKQYYLRKAEDELARIKPSGDECIDEGTEKIRKIVMDVINAYDMHEGGTEYESAQDIYTNALFMATRIMADLPLTPLTGEDDEWEPFLEWPDGSIDEQNKRCPNVTRHNGKIYCTETHWAKYVDEKTWWLYGEPVDFPYLPKLDKPYIVRSHLYDKLRRLFRLEDKMITDSLIVGPACLAVEYAWHKIKSKFGESNVK